MNETRQYIYGHISKETAYIVNDYPWGFRYGFRLRTQKRYWIESKKGFGQRFCSQTLDPQTDKWCKPKYSTYDEITIIFLDNEGHISNTGLNGYDNLEVILKFKEFHYEFLDEFQKEQLKELIAVATVMENVTFTSKISSVGPVSLLSNDPIEIEKRKRLYAEQEENKKQQEKSLSQINLAIAYERSKL